MSTITSRGPDGDTGRPPAIVKAVFGIACPQARAVFLAGSFNDWSPDTLPLVEVAPGLWSLEVTLARGWYEYLFVVDGEWVVDPDAPEYCPNEFGGLNSARRVS